MKKTYYLIFGIAFISCKGSTMWREEHGLIKEYDFDYRIHSIRVDDDAEYHIVAVSNSGNVETIKDADVPYDIEMKYGNFQYPILRYHISDRCCGEGNMVREGHPIVLLPYNYNVETFDD